MTNVQQQKTKRYRFKFFAQIQYILFYHFNLVGNLYYNVYSLPLMGNLCRE